MDMAIRFGA